jgi:hypothetical protein
MFNEAAFIAVDRLERGLPLVDVVEQSSKLLLVYRTFTISIEHF